MEVEATMSETNGYKYLGPRKGGSLYRQLFIKGTRIRAEVIARVVGGKDERTPEEVAADYNLPLDVVLECIKYCDENADLLREEWEEEEADLARRRQEDPKHYPVPPKP
jgi:uncharacterized protein (DUF433 family)